jgi:hypothetical protein
MSTNIETIADKKFKSRKIEFEKALEDEDEKEKLFKTIAGSVEIFLPPESPEESDGIILYTNADGKIVDGEYYYSKGEEVPISLPLSDKDLTLFKEAFIDFKLE